MPSRPFKSSMEIERIGRGLMGRTLPKSCWDHCAHFAAALWFIDMDNTEGLPSVIRAYNEAVGTANTDSSGYHETITYASIRAARSFRTARKHIDLFEVCNELMASPLGQPGWLLHYWSRDVLFSTNARRRWVEPNLRPFEM